MVVVVGGKGSEVERGDCEREEIQEGRRTRKRAAGLGVRDFNSSGTLESRGQAPSQARADSFNF